MVVHNERSEQSGLYESDNGTPLISVPVKGLTLCISEQYFLEKYLPREACSTCEISSSKPLISGYLSSTASAMK